MAIANSLVKSPAKEQVIEYMAGDTQIKLTPAIIKNYLVSGDKDKVSSQEIVMFANLCKFAGLNPWMKEAYCIKYGNEPATMVVGKEAFLKRAEAHPAYDGDESGIIVVDGNGVITYRKGTVKLPGETIIGGYAEVWRKDRTHSKRVEVSFEEFCGKKKDGTLNGQWAKKPALMIRKVALVQALREAFPASFGAMYTAEEQGFEESSIIDVIPNEQPTEPAPAHIQSQNQADDPESALFGN